MKITVGGVACGLAAVLGFGGVTIAQDAVQWRVEDGGNGHWYVASREPQPINWHTSLQAATARGGHLPYVRNDAHDALLLSLFLPLLDDEEFGPALGARRIAGDAQTVCSDWRWMDGSPFDYLPPMPPNGVKNGYGAPDGCESTCQCLNDFYPDEHYLQYWRARFPIWNSASSSSPSPVLLIEYSADCNGDGIVDYGQILDGTLIDTNGNGIPDCCEFGFPCFPDSCPADLNNDGIVNGADISIMLGFWGLNGKPVDADINGDGLVDGADLAMLLSSWGKCP